ncbi:MAG: hypothetical protein FWG38_11150, partial [Defluviitaleaceae bacterium]|nr:hypothetical protein [Defluviitaleaceae bacterium]
MTMTRQMFAGGLTPAGFTDFFDYIMPLKDAKRRYFLKGASGSGKSTLMKKVAAAFEAARVDMDLFYCANDAASLDGLAVKDAGFCMLDATAPHAHDPALPGAIDETIDFAQFLDGKKLYKYVGELTGLLDTKGQMVKKAQRFLVAAGNVYAAESARYRTAMAKPAIRKVMRDCLGAFKQAHCADMSMETDRKLFLSAVTPDGVVSFADKVLSAYKVYGLYGAGGTHVVLTGLKNFANMRGICTESFFCPLEPTRR